MAHTFWRGEHIVLQRDDGTADIYEWQPVSGSYAWLGDYASTDEAERTVREMEALPELPEIKPISTTPVKPDLRAVPEAEWTDVHEAELRRRVAEDPDDWMPSEADMAQARPFAEAYWGDQLQAGFDRVWVKAAGKESEMSPALDIGIIVLCVYALLYIACRAYAERKGIKP